MILRPYQSAAVDAARAAFSRGSRAVLLVAPTGSGKGAIAAHVMLRAVALGGRALFIVHRREIVRDVSNRLVNAGCSNVCTWLGGSRIGSDLAPIQVCSVQTLIAGEVRPPATVLVWDEAHHVVASTYRALRSAYPDAIHLGLTATPERSDRTALGSEFDTLLPVASVRELVAAGHLVACDVLAPPAPGKELASDPIEALVRESSGRAGVLFASSVAESKAYAARYGDKAAHLDGTTPKDERDAILARFADGSIDLLCNMNVLTEGWDAPRAKVCVLARPMGSAGAFLQATGRVLRPDGSGAKALLLDLCGSVYAHGMPDEDRVFSLTGKAISSKPKNVSPWTCKTCWAVLALRPEVCPRCGAEAPAPPPPVVRKQALARPVSVATQGERRAFFDSLCRDVAAKGHKPAAIGMRYRARFGTWPPWPIPGMQRGRVSA